MLLLRLWHYISHVLTYLLTYHVTGNSVGRKKWDKDKNAEKTC